MKSGKSPHKIDEILIDDDQDSIWLKVTIEGLGASCHVGYKSCFYRSVDSIEKDEKRGVNSLDTGNKPAWI